MPHLICPSCGLSSYSAAAFATVDLCPRCDRPLKGAERTHDGARGWDVADVRLLARYEEVEHEAR